MMHYSIDFSDMAEFSALAQSIQARLSCKGCLISVVDEDALSALGHAPKAAHPANHALSGRDLICARTVVHGAPVRVPDITKDPHFRRTSTATETGILAYIGVPLRLNGGAVVGAICGLSAEPRIWTASEVEYMLALADLAESKIERHVLRYEQKALSAALAETDAILSVLAETRDRSVTVQNAAGELVFANAALRTNLGLNHRDLMHLPPLVASIVAAGRNGADVVVNLSGRPATRMRAQVSPVKSGLIMADWTLLKS